MVGTPKNDFNAGSKKLDKILNIVQKTSRHIPKYGEDINTAAASAKKINAHARKINSLYINRRRGTKKKR